MHLSGVHREPGMKLIQKFVRDESGATAIEYALICGLIFLAIVAAVTNFASKASTMYGNIAANMK